MKVASSLHHLHVLLRPSTEATIPGCPFRNTLCTCTFIRKYIVGFWLLHTVVTYCTPYFVSVFELLSITL